MPIYEYYCARCESGYEAMRPVSMMDEPAPCPKCGEPGLRQLSAFAFKNGRYGAFYKSTSPSASSNNDYSLAAKHSMQEQRLLRNS